MKRSVYYSRLLTGIAMLIFCLSGCKKKDDIVRIQSIVPQHIIDDLKAKGMVINEGIEPPTIEDAFVASPYTLKARYGSDDNYDIGEVIQDYYYKFYDQNKKNEIKYDFYSSGGGDQGVGTGAFIAGEGNKFTIFSEEIGESHDIPYKSVTIISGEVASNGIKNFQYAFIIKEKTGDDDDEVLIGVDKGRVWYDGDFVSESINDFRTSAVTSVTSPVTNKSMFSKK